MEQCNGLAIFFGHIYRCERDNGHSDVCVIVDKTDKCVDVVPVFHTVLEMKNDETRHSQNKIPVQASI